jgi:uncharacterized RDD family membrane protein YckC
MYCTHCGHPNLDDARYCARCGQEMIAPVESPASSEVMPEFEAPPAPQAYVPAIEYAGFWLRFIATIIDGFLLTVLITIVFGFDYWTSKELSYENLIAFGVGWLYYAMWHSSSYQATLGKRAVGIYVTDLNGGRISFARATGRYFATILSGCMLLIGYIMVAFTAKKQAFHDMLADTLVVKR